MSFPSIEAPARKSAQIISRHYPRDLSEPSIKAAISIAPSMDRHLAPLLLVPKQFNDSVDKAVINFRLVFSFIS